jgi:hypothetical protein
MGRDEGYREELEASTILVTLFYWTADPELR